MGDNSIEKIKRVPLREVWKHEAKDFTTWLEKNIDVLSEAINLNLSNIRREQSAGAFSVDLVAEDDMGSHVVIESQLNKSDHDHLGKLITYLVALDASIAIWIVSDPRPEHINALTWLNESPSVSFYLIKVEAIRIGDSVPAPLLTLIVAPSAEGREVGKTKKGMAESHEIKYRFWQQLLENANKKTKLHVNISPSKNEWISTGAGIGGLEFNYLIRKNEAQVEFYIDRGKDKDLENKKIFDELFKHKDKIEQAFGESLEWMRLDTKRSSRIKKAIPGGGWSSTESKWPEIQNLMIENMIRLEKALKPFIEKLKSKSSTE